MLSIIVAKAKNNVIGKDNTLIWHISDDLKRFKQLTTGHTIIMGRKTFESLGRVLPNRHHVVLCKNTKLHINNENVEIINNNLECDLNGDFVEARTIYPLTIMRNSNYENFNNFKIIIDIKIKNNIKEKTDMKNMFGNFYFGPYIKNDIKMSIKGLAYRNNNNDFVTLDEDGSLTNVNDMVFDFNVDKMLYVMPVALKDVKTGDIIFHQKNPMFVTMVNDGDLTVVDPCEGELKVIIPEKNIFNFNFVSKLVDFSKGLFNGATEEQPFGNMLPLMMLCNSDDSSMKDLIVPMMLMQNNGEADINKINPIMFMALMSNSSSTNDWIVPMMLMQNGGFNFGAVAE